MNNKIFVCGDTHIPIDIQKLNTKNWQEQKTLTKNDILIQLGDFGGLWYYPDNRRYKEDKYWQEWLANKPFTFCFIDGNHENFTLLNNLPVIEKFGGKVGVIKTKKGEIYHLKRGEIYTINNKKIFTIGGATSIDKFNRTENINWWKEEIPDYKETNYIIDQANKIDKIDYVLSHTCPVDTAVKILAKYTHNYSNNNYVEKIIDPMSKLLQEIYLIVKNKGLKEWHFGHWHFDDKFYINNIKFQCHYNNKPVELI